MRAQPVRSHRSDEVATEYRVPVSGTTHEMIEIDCELCGPHQALWPVSALVLLVGQHLPCEWCFAESSTRVTRDVDIADWV